MAAKAAQCLSTLLERDVALISTNELRAIADVKDVKQFVGYQEEWWEGMQLSGTSTARCYGI